MLGVHLVLYLSLPYLLLQQSIYGLWLLGGGGVVLSVLLGLLAAGLLFGPTVYCAAICPTGATLSFLGRARVVRLHVAESARCGQSCHLCETACWLQLDPRSGDPGPDCDLCGRCVPACPQAQLGIGVSPPRLTTMRSLALLVALGGSTLWPDAALAGEVKPRLVLEQERRFEDVTVAVSLVDLSGVKLNFDWAQAQSGTDLSVYIVRGELARPDEHGLIPQRETYAGPLRVALHLGDGGAARSVEFAVPNHPISTHAPVDPGFPGGSGGVHGAPRRSARDDSRARRRVLRVVPRLLRSSLPRARPAPRPAGAPARCAPGSTGEPRYSGFWRGSKRSNSSAGTARLIR
jgi:ferredoxin